MGVSLICGEKIPFATVWVRWKWEKGSYISFLKNLCLYFFEEIFAVDN